MHIENVPMHIEVHWINNFSHTKNQHGGTCLGGIHSHCILQGKGGKGVELGCND